MFVGKFVFLIIFELNCQYCSLPLAHDVDNRSFFLHFTLQHPVLDEPVAEAVCIIADTDRWTVQVASSQRPSTENKLGKDVLVSNLVSNLLHSTYQLYRLNLSPNFVSAPL